MRMDGPGQVSFAFPRPGRALTVVLVLVGAFGIVTALLANWVAGGWPPARLVLEYLVCTPDMRPWELWRLFTSALLTDSPTHLIMTLLGLYFLSPDLERRWGAARFVSFLLLSVAGGNLLVLAGNAVPFTAGPFAAPAAMLGAYAAITAIAVAW